MNSLPLPRIVFFYVKDVKSKLSKIAWVAQQHFLKKEHLLFAAQDQKSVEFVDELLWKDPEESFIPHSVSENFLSDLIVITQQKKNLNSAKYLFNLCPTPLFFETAVKIIYEFEDATTPSKHQLSLQRFEAYKAAKYPLEAR